MTNPDGITVVIAARNTGMAKTMRMALRGTGVRSIHLASTPAEALEALGSVEPHVLMIVVEAPENDEGLSLIRFIRGRDNAAIKSIPIVAASSRRDMPTVKAVIDAGGNEYVVLPASGDSLLKKITSALRAER